MKFLVKFKNFDQLICNIDDTNVGEKYYELTKKTYQEEFPVYRDRPKFTKKYMSELAIVVNQQLGWSWDFRDTSIKHTAQMHKDIETLLMEGFSKIPAELDHVIHDLHYGLHILQHNIEPNRLGWLQIEWYNDVGFDMELFPFKHKLELGDVKLQNPYVGHGPLQIYLEQDFQQISQTCKFHDFVKPGINIVTVTEDEFTDFDDLLSKFKQHDPAFVARHSSKKIVDYTGYPVIGQVENIDLLEQIISYNSVLELESIEFD